MAVTELALLRILHPNHDNNIPTELVDKLKQAAFAQADASHSPVAIYQCIEEPSLICLIGGWASVDVHMNEWIPGPKNQELLRLLGDDLGVERLDHLDIEPSRVFGRELAGCQDGLIGFGRGVVKSGAKTQFASVYGENKWYLEENIGGPERVACGWKADKAEEEQDVFAMFTHWDSVEEHTRFSQSEGHQNYVSFWEFLESADMKHGRRVILAVPATS